MYFFDLAGALTTQYPHRFYSAEEVQKIVDTLCGGMVVRPPEIEMAGRLYQLPATLSGAKILVEKYPHWLRNDLTFCAGILAACEQPKGKPARTAYGANAGASRFILEHPELETVAMYRATSYLLGFRPTDSRAKATQADLLALTLALSREDDGACLTSETAKGERE